MEVKLLYHTPIEVAYLSARTCYSAEGPITMAETNTKTKEEMVKFIKGVMKSGHLSTVEGINFSFAIEGVSRALLAQFTRHRTGIQFSVQSQRYVTYDNIETVTPKSILDNEEALTIYNETLSKIENSYKALVELGIPAEDARYLLSNATTTNISTTINLRELVHIMGLRRCTRAQAEIRTLMKLMVDEVIKVEPWLEELLQPQCVQEGFCRERKSCGRKPTLSSMLKEEMKGEINYV